MADKRIPRAQIRAVWLDPALTRREAAAIIGITPANLWKRATAMGLPARKDGRHLPPIPADFPDMWRAGVNGPDLCRVLGMSRPNVTYHARRLGLPLRASGVVGISLAAFRLMQAEARDAELRRIRMSFSEAEAEDAI